MSLEQRMVYGHETEFAITTIPNSPWPVDHDEVIREVFSHLKQTRTIGIFRQRTKEKLEPAKGILLYNGGTLYEDIGHLEYATPECATLDQTVAAILAGRRLAANVINQVDRRNALKGNAPPLPSHIVLALNSDFTLDSNNGRPNVHASHENYSDGIDDEYQTMMLFLATRGIFTDPGFVLNDKMRKKYGGHMATSARALATYVTQTSRGEEVMLGSFKHVFMIKEGNRLQIALGSENISHVAMKLKFGTTGLVHELARDGYEPNLATEATAEELATSIQSLAMTPSREGAERWLVRLGDRLTSAITIQRMFLEEAKKRFKGRNRDTNWTLHMWERTLDALEQNPDKANWIDWVLKGKIVRDLMKSGVTTQQLIRADEGYHMLGTEDTIFNWARKKYPYPEVYDIPEDTIRQAKLFPPSDTRALYRGAAIHTIGQMDSCKNNNVTTRLSDDWSTLTVYWFSGGRLESTKLEMPNPQGHYAADMKRFLKDVQSKRANFPLVHTSHYKPLYEHLKIDILRKKQPNVKPIIKN